MKILDIPSERPFARAHPAFGLRAVDPGEPLHALTEKQLPAEWRSLGDDEWGDLQEEYYRALLRDLGQHRVLYFLADLTDSNEVERLRRLGASPGPRPYSVIGRIAEQIWMVLLRCKISAVVVHDEAKVLVGRSPIVCFGRTERRALRLSTT